MAERGSLPVLRAGWLGETEGCQQERYVAGGGTGGRSVEGGKVRHTLSLRKLRDKDPVIDLYPEYCHSVGVHTRSMACAPPFFISKWLLLASAHGSAA